MKMYKDLKIISTSIFFGIVLSSCSNIIVSKGPFPIPVDQEKIEFKNSWLNAQTENTEGEERPNVVMIIVDDLGKEDIALYNPNGIQTPNINRLADEGVLFSNAYSSCSVCSPSRAGLFTGRYQQRFGFERQPMNQYARNKMEYFIVDHLINTEPMRLISTMSKVTKEEISKQGIPNEEILISEIMQSNGYSTGICGKWHLGHNDPFRPNERGFDFHYGFYEAFTLYAPVNSEGIIDYRHEYFANKHIWRQKRKETCAIRVNDSIVKEEEYLTFSIAKQSIQFIEDNKDEPFFLVTAFSAPHTPFQVPVEYYNLFSHIEDENKRVYYGMIAALDDGVGMITSALDSMGLADNTLIIFCSDNGGATYTKATENGSLKAGKFSQFEGGVNIPMIINWGDKLNDGRVYSKPVCLLDLFPTIASSADIRVPDDRPYDGVNLLPFLNMDDESPHEYLYWRTEFNRAIRNNEWKLIWNVRDKLVFLYDLKSDKPEGNNVADQHPDIVEFLKSAYRLWDAEMIAPSWPGVMEFKFDIDGEVSWWAI